LEEDGGPSDDEYDAIMDDFVPPDEDQDQEGGRGPGRSNNVRGYVRYLNEAKSRINDLLQLGDLTHVFSNIETMYQLKEDSEGVTLLGRFLSINQGIPTKHVDRLNKMYGIEQTVQDKIKGIAISDIGDGTGVPEPGIPKPFKLMEFFSDKVKQKQWIEAYAKTGETFNVLQIVADSPHFSEMWGAFVTVQQAMDNQTIKSRLTEKFTRKLKEGNYIKKLT
jgi:hypothetical protein